MTLITRMVLLLVASISLSACRFVETVPYVEIPRYMGLWY